MTSNAALLMGCVRCNLRGTAYIKTDFNGYSHIALEPVHVCRFRLILSPDDDDKAVNFRRPLTLRNIAFVGKRI